MKRTSLLTTVVICFIAYASYAFAQLPSNPWKVKTVERDTNYVPRATPTPRRTMPNNRRTMPTDRATVPYAGSNKNHYYGSPQATNKASTANTANSGISTMAANPMFDNALPVDPWARARDYSGTTSWRQSGNHGYLDYRGEATTWTEAQGQEMIAPEVNRHNMLVMTQHLRDMGYKIPDSYDSNIQNMPENYRRRLERAYQDLDRGRDPFSNSLKGMMGAFEKGTGLDLNNIMFNTMNILSTD